MKIITFFNNKGGVGKTTLAYHISYMLSEMGKTVLAVDLDPQANLTSMCLSVDRFDELYAVDEQNNTVKSSLKNIEKGLGDITDAHIESINPKLNLLLGDLDLSLFEDKLSENWGKCLDGDERAFRIISAFYRIIKNAAEKIEADYIIIDIGPNFGAINRSVLISSDYIIVPTAADLYSLQGLKNIGDRLFEWKKAWEKRLPENPEATLDLPQGNMKPLGYVLLQHNAKDSRPVKAYLKWADRIPLIFDEFVLKNRTSDKTIVDDDNCLAQIKHYHSLMPMAMEARKPIFLLKPADGAIGAHFSSVKDVYKDFEKLTKEIVYRTS